MQFSIKTKPKGATEAIEVLLDLPRTIAEYIDRYSEAAILTIVEQHILKAARTVVKKGVEEGLSATQIQEAFNRDFSPIPPAVQRKLDTARKAAEGLSPVELAEHLRWLNRHVTGPAPASPAE